MYGSATCSSCTLKNEVVYHHRRSMSDHLNKKWAVRLRNRVLHRIEQRQWLQFIGGVLVKKGLLLCNDFNYSKPVDADDLERLGRMEHVAISSVGCLIFARIFFKELDSKNI